MSDARLQQIDAISRKLTPAIVFAAVSAWFFQAFILAPDLFWHLAAGRDICQRGAVPRTDPFSYTFAGREWINHEWLWDILYWKLYQFSPDAVAWFTIVLVVAAFSLTFLAAFDLCGSMLASGIAVWLAAMTAYWFLDIRPHIVTLLMVSIILVTRNQKWAPWLWPPLIVLWANLHAGFTFGVGMIGLLVLVRTLEKSWHARRWAIPRAQWLSVALCLVAWLVNPFGWKLAEFQFDYFLHDSPYRNLIEWKPPPFGLDPTYYEGSFWWLAILTLAGIAVSLRERKHWYFIALCAVAFFLAVTSRRFIPLFAIISAPLVALLLIRIGEFLAEQIQPLKSPWMLVGVNLVAVAVAATMWSHVSFQSGLLRQWAMGDLLPEDAIRYLNALGPPKRVMNYYIWGGPVMLDCPGAKVFIDPRANTLYGDTIYRDNVRFTAGDVTPGRLSRYEADVALLPFKEFAAALENLSPPWTPIYEDVGSVILAPPGSPLLKQTQPKPEEVLKDCVEPLIALAFAAYDRNEVQQATEIYEATIRMFPYSIRCYSFLLRIHAQQGEFDKVDALVAAGLQSNPRQADNLYLQQGGAYREVGQTERALTAYEKARAKGPFSNRDDLERLIETLKTEIARNKRGF